MKRIVERGKARGIIQFVMVHQRPVRQLPGADKSGYQGTGLETAAEPSMEATALFNKVGLKTNKMGKLRKRSGGARVCRRSDIRRRGAGREHELGTVVLGCSNISGPGER
jgi:hypothetical protein